MARRTTAADDHQVQRYLKRNTVKLTPRQLALIVRCATKERARILAGPMRVSVKAIEAAELTELLRVIETAAAQGE